MGTCLSTKKGSSASSSVSGVKSVSTAPTQQKDSGNVVTVTLSNKPEVSLKNKKSLQEKQYPDLVKEDEGQVKKEIFIIKHRKSHDDRERSSKISPCSAQQNVPAQPVDGLASSASTSEAAESESMYNKVAPPTPNMGVMGVRTSSCTKEEVDAILIQCGRLSRSSSGKAASSSAGRKYSGSKRSYDFDHCDNDTISAEDDPKRANASDNSEEYDGVAAENRHHQHRPRHRQSPRKPSSSSSSSQGRRRTPSRERDQQRQRSSSRERRVSRSPGRRSSETTTSSANASNNNTASRPGKMVSVPATVSSLVMDKSNNGGGGGEPAAATSNKRITVKRNVGDCGMVGSRSAASPRSQSPARANGNAANAKVLCENQQQQPSLSRNNSSRKTEQSPYKRNPLSEVDPNSLAYPQSNSTSNGCSKVQNKPKKEIEAVTNQKPNIDVNDSSRNRTSGRVALEKSVGVNYKTKEIQEEEIKSSVPDDSVVKTMVVPSGVDNLKPQTLTRSRSSRRSRDLDINPEALLNPTQQSYTSLLLEDIQNFHQKNIQQPSVSLPACLTKACSILEAVADLNSTTSSNFSGAFSEDKRSPPTCQSIRNDYNVPLGANHYGKRGPDAKEPFIESEVVVSDDVMEPSLHKYVTVKRGGSLGGVDMEDQESSGSNSFTVSSGQHHWGISYSSWEPNSADSTDCWTSRLNTREEGQRSPLGLDGNLSSEAGKKTTTTLDSKRRECDHQHSSGIGRGRLSSNKGLHSLSVVTATAST